MTGRKFRRVRFHVWVCVIVLALGPTLAAPLARADAMTGEFLVRETIALPQESNMGVSPLAMLVPDATTISAFTLTSPRIHVYVASDTYYDTQGMQLGLPERERAGFDLADVSVSLARSGPGWVGLYPRPGNMQATFEDGPDSSVTARRATVLTSSAGVSSEGGVERDLPYYHSETVGPHLFIEASGNVLVGGAGAIKIHGPDVRIVARENTTTYETGIDRQPDAPFQQTVDRWLVLEFTDAEIHLTTAEAVQATAASATAQWSGNVALQAERGTIQTEEADYVATRGPVELGGAFAATLRPVAQSGEPLTLLTLEGDLVSTNLVGSASTIARPPLNDSMNLPVLLVGVAVGVSAIAYGVSRHQRQRKTPPVHTLDDCLAFANLAAEAERFGEALQWVREARKRAPGSARLALDEGFYLQQLGDVDGALSAYSESTNLSEDGEAAFLAAVLLAGTGARAEDVEASLGLALERTPSLVLEVLSDAAFDALRNRPTYGRLIRAALRRVDRSNA